MNNSRIYRSDSTKRAEARERLNQKNRNRGTNEEYQQVLLKELKQLKP